MLRRSLFGRQVHLCIYVLLCSSHVDLFAEVRKFAAKQKQQFVKLDSINKRDVSVVQDSDMPGNTE